MEPESTPTIFDRLRETYSTFSRQQKAIADHLLNLGPEAAFLSCNQLAKASGTSPATVVRFMQSLGYPKYNYFIEELHALLIKGHRPMSKLTASLSGDEGAGPTLENSGSFDIQSILDLSECQQEQILVSAIELLVSARRIFITGARSAFSLAHYTGFLLSEMANNVQYFPAGAEDGFERLETAGPDDVLLVISFHRYARSAHQLARYSAKNKTKVIALTDSLNAPIGIFSDIVLLGPSRTPFYSYVAPMAVLNALIWGFARAKSDDVSDILEQRQNMLLSQKIFI
jgi:DNA-binding MurR/RpiR family transcriptional regulator